MPPCSGCRLDSSAITAASGTKNTRHAKIHSVTDGAPSRALREIHRSPVTATMFMAMTSHKVRDVIRPLIVRVMPSGARGAGDLGALDLAIDVGLHFRQRAFPAAAHDREVAFEPRAFALAALLHHQHGLAAVAVRAALHFERHRPDRIAVGRLPVDLGEKE